MTAVEGAATLHRRQSAGPVKPFRTDYRSRIPIDNTGRNNLATLLIACVNLQSGAGFLEGFGHSFNCGGTKGSLVGQVFTDRHRKKLLCCRVIAQAIFASKCFLRGRPFAIFLNDCSSHTGGDRGRERSAGRAPRDGGNTPHSR